MKVVLIILGVIAGLIFLYFILKLLTKPKIKIASKVDNPVKQTKKETQNVEVKKVEGLNFEEKFIVEEEKRVDLSSLNNDFMSMKKPLPAVRSKKKTQKSLAEQISELSPELKLLILDKSLATKDIEIKSKKN